MLYFLLSLLTASGAAWRGHRPWSWRRAAEELNLNQTFFPSLEGYQVNASPVSEAQYPWIARVVHSRALDTPHMCTAACVQERIFITAARCIYSLKVTHTSIIYMSQRLKALAFVVPSNGSKQAFDDVGLVVVHPGYSGHWATVQMYDEKRTDNMFRWFADMHLEGPGEYVVVGYATEKGLHKIRTPYRQFNLTELKVAVSINLCSTILTFNHFITGFYVPCYHSCSLQAFKHKAATCSNYHGVEGGAVINVKTNKLVGVATWGAYFHNHELPVGFSVPNSDNFFKDYVCAERIRNDNRDLGTTGNFQILCDD